MIEKLTNALSATNFNVPSILFCNYKELNLTDEEFITIIYLINNKGSFNPKEISSTLNKGFNDVLQIINRLIEKDIIDLNVITINGIKEEVIDVSKLYKKLAFFLVNGKEEKVVSEDIFSKFEKEFGRTLSPIEYELIRGWIDNDFNEEIILSALKEAVFNGVNNLRYIDKILYEWRKKGIKSTKDIVKFQKKNNKEINNEQFDYDWLNDNE